MQWLWFASGGAVLLVLAMDVLWTTLRVGEGAGPITRRVTTGVWRGALAVHRRRNISLVLNLGGLLLTLLTLMVWIALLWGGWTLIFSASPDSVLQGSTKEPAGIWDRLYFVNYTITSLGIGDYRPAGALWQMLTALATLTGFSLMTLSISYLVPVVSAVVERRAAASYITTLGRTPEEILVNTCLGESQTLDQHLAALTPTLLTLLEQRSAYPVVQFFHSMDRRNAVPISVASLDEALTILELGIRGGCKPHAGVLGPARHALGMYIMAMDERQITLAHEPPPPPDLAPIRAAGFDTVPQAEFDRRLEHLRERRRRLESELLREGFNWRSILPQPDGKGVRKDTTDPEPP